MGLFTKIDELMMAWGAERLESANRDITHARRYNVVCTQASKRFAPKPRELLFPPSVAVGPFWPAGPAWLSGIVRIHIGSLKIVLAPINITIRRQFLENFA